jgi:2-polyprenyl-3-methyl-5-hydroxy-6-metoxy-1,4-benzoquinol methylase
VGLEPFSAAGEFCRSAFGLDVRTGKVLDTPFEPESFDVIIMTEVIEHLKNPVYNMMRLSEYAKPGAILMLTSPNADSPAANMMRGQWIGLGAPSHLQFFNHENLQMLLSRTGWRVLKIKSGGGYPGQIMAFARRLR